MLADGTAITFTALLYPRHTITYPEITLLKVNRCGKGKSLLSALHSFVNILHRFLTL